MAQDEPERPEPLRQFQPAPFALVTCAGATFCFMHRAIIPAWDPFLLFTYLRGVRGAGEAAALTLAYYLPWILPAGYALGYRLIRRARPGTQWDVAIGCVVAMVIGFAMWPEAGT